MSKHYADWALGAILLAAGAALLWLTVPLDTFLGQALVDDALYYLVPARNFSCGLGVSIDGLNLTNGYHPLWMLLAIVGVYLTPDKFEIYLLPAMSGAFCLLGALGQVCCCSRGKARGRRPCCSRFSSSTFTC